MLLERTVFAVFPFFRGAGGFLWGAGPAISSSPFCRWGGFLPRSIVNFIVNHFRQKEKLFFVVRPHFFKILFAPETGSSASPTQKLHTGRSSGPASHRNSSAPPAMPSAVKIRSSPSPASTNSADADAAVRQNAASSTPPQTFPPSRRKAPSTSYSSPRQAPRAMARRKASSCWET